MFDGTTATFEMLKRPDTVKIIAVVDEQIAILEQEQPNLKQYLDIPGGRHDDESEDELAAAKRELLEETGMTFADWKVVDVWQKHPKIESFNYVFVATNHLKTVEQNLDSGEKIALRWVSFNNYKRLSELPTSRYFPVDLLRKLDSLNDLLNVKAYQP